MRKIASIMIVSMLLFSMILIAPMVGADPGTTLSATVSATGHWTRTFDWTITKSVTPETWDLFTGDSGTSQYTIAVTKDSGTDAWYIDGTVYVTNGGAVATKDLTITIEVRDGFPPPKDLIATASVDVSGNPVLDPGETGSYPYQVGLTVIGTGVYKVTAVVTIMNHSGYEDPPRPFGPSPSADAYLPGTPTLIYDTIHVDDTNGGSWAFSASGSVSYEKTFTCADEGDNVNTATIRETGDSASATVTVNCYDLEVSKDAQTYFTRTYMWTIVKTGDQTYLELKKGDTFDVHYTITVDATFTDSDWMVKQINGIMVHNPAPIPATIKGLTDLVSPDIAADVYLPVDLPYTLAAGGDLIALYKAKLPDATSRTNTATATLQNYAYKYDGSKTATGTTDFSGTADVDFEDAIITEVDKSITVSDTYAGDLGTVTYGDAPKTFTYTRTIGPYDPGDYTVDNTASFVTSDTGTTGESSWTVDVHVPLPPSGQIGGIKFYDSNVNGVRDGVETGISGWPIQLYQLQTDGTWLLISETTTGPAGDYSFINLAPGTYKVAEVIPTPPPMWIATTATSFEATLTDGEIITAPDFGNVQLTCGHGGLTIGYWTNKNGQALITASDVTALNGLNLYKINGYPPFSGSLSTAKTQIKNYLLSANAVDMRYMLSAQLIATKLDTLHGLSAGTIVYVGPSIYVPTGFITIGDIMNNANAALLGTNRAEQEYWKNLLDGVNNNRLPFVVV